MHGSLATLRPPERSVATPALPDYVRPSAGQVSGLIKEIKPAAEILRDMVEEAVDILTRKLPESVTARA